MLTSTLWLALLQLAERFLIRPFSQYVSRNNVELFDYFANILITVCFSMYVILLLLLLDCVSTTTKYLGEFTDMYYHNHHHHLHHLHLHHHYQRQFVDTFSGETANVFKFTCIAVVQFVIVVHI